MSDYITILPENGDEIEYYATGAKRSNDKGKPRFDLVVPEAHAFINYAANNRLTIPLHELYEQLTQFQTLNTRDGLVTALTTINRAMAGCEYPSHYYDPLSCYNDTLKRLAGVLGRGAAYGERNWQLGIPLTRHYQSMYRHVHGYFQDKLEVENGTPPPVVEDHYGAFWFNSVAFYWTLLEVEHGKLDRGVVGDMIS